MSAEESKALRVIIRQQPPGNSTPFVLLKKIHCALKWKYSQTKKPNAYKKILEDVAPAFTKGGAEVEL